MTGIEFVAGSPASYGVAMGIGFTIGWITRAALGEWDKAKSGRHQRTRS